ncbi:PREDICTED: transmembrane emp24 domain-containing protein 7-like [Priapulus caudatus]|uniref:Transmembrane emp24 domain-containing protein 7-like n=1 Tax=Priapulus caudatus TaxID=37621 RepID=A0ABM1DT90_PRICU|nr:PREDICTED: transmembrane emp24 domain-containing protein 7-like [Priapulus caudatus]
METCSICLLVLGVASILSISLAVELTFELPDDQRQCFHENIDRGVNCTIEFQVVTGGQYDVDMTLEAPNKAFLHKVARKQYDSFSWQATIRGTYTVCFSNEMSTFTHKVVYMDFIVGDEPTIIPGKSPHIATAMTQMEVSSATVHESLKVVIDYQTHHRLREAQGRRRAEGLNDRVMWWSIGVTVVIVVVMVGQVLLLRSFFSEKHAHHLYQQT